MRTAGIDYDLGRVVLCSIDFDGSGVRDAVLSEEIVKTSPRMDLAERYRVLHDATHTVWTRFAATDVASVCVEAPGSGRPSIGLKLMGSFGAVATATPRGVTLCSMSASEWKKVLGLPQNKALAHTAILSRYPDDITPEVASEHHMDALCIALAWRQLQQEHVA